MHRNSHGPHLGKSTAAATERRAKKCTHTQHRTAHKTALSRKLARWIGGLRDPYPRGEHTLFGSGILVFGLEEFDELGALLGGKTNRSATQSEGGTAVSGRGKYKSRV